MSWRIMTADISGIAVTFIGMLFLSLTMRRHGRTLLAVPSGPAADPQIGPFHCLCHVMLGGIAVTAFHTVRDR